MIKYSLFLQAITHLDDTFLKHLTLSVVSHWYVVIITFITGVSIKMWLPFSGYLITVIIVVIAGIKLLLWKWMKLSNLPLIWPSIQHHFTWHIPIYFLLITPRKTSLCIQNYFWSVRLCVIFKNNLLHVIKLNISGC